LGALVHTERGIGQILGVKIDGQAAVKLIADRQIEREVLIVILVGLRRAAGSSEIPINKIGG
jgi:hypothetical protein